MLFGAVTFVTIKTIVWIVSVVALHEPVTTNFGDDAGRCDRGDKSVAIDYGCLG